MRVCERDGITKTDKWYTTETGSLCGRCYRADYRAKNREKIQTWKKASYARDSAPAKRRALKRRTEKPNEIRIRKQEYYRDNKEEVSKQHKKYYEENKDEALARNALWRGTHPEEMKKYKEKWYGENRDLTIARERQRYRDKKEYLKIQAKAYRLANPHISKAAKAKRRARLMDALPDWADLDALREFYRLCPKGMHVDHIIPLAGKEICGLHVVWNLQYLTPEENSLKGYSFDGTYNNEGWRTDKRGRE